MSSNSCWYAIVILSIIPAPEKHKYYSKRYIFTEIKFLNFTLEICLCYITQNKFLFGVKCWTSFSYALGNKFHAKLSIIHATPAQAASELLILNYSCFGGTYNKLLFIHYITCLAFAWLLRLSHCDSVFSNGSHLPLLLHIYPSQTSMQTASPSFHHLPSASASGNQVVVPLKHLFMSNHGSISLLWLYDMVSGI